MSKKNSRANSRKYDDIASGWVGPWHRNSNRNKKNNYDDDDELDKELQKLARENSQKAAKQNKSSPQETARNSISFKDVLKINKRYMNDIKELKSRFGDVAVNQVFFVFSAWERSRLKKRTNALDDL